MSSAAPDGSAQPHALALRERGGRAELGVAAFLCVLGLAVIIGGTRISENLAQTGVIGPKVVPFLVGGLLVFVSIMLGVNILRGGRGEPEGSEDVDLSQRSDWMTMGLLAIAFLANALLIETLGWPISGAILFFLAAFALGSRHLIRDAILAIVLSFGSWYLFDLGLGVNLPVGVLTGIL
jgi:putative tricarboxylic transport membrane protein